MTDFWRSQLGNLTTLLQQTLASTPYSLSVARISIDDLYLPHDGLVALAAANPLGTDILGRLQHINDPDAHGDVCVPQFDKSLYNGEGDRVDEGTIIRPVLDVLILEGWCVGFYPVSTEVIDARWDQPVQGLGDDFFRVRGFRKEDVKDINERLKGYLAWWDCFHAFIQIKPEDSHPYTHIYKWRLEQEHHMKYLNGGKGMTDAQVEAFVDRYIPGYVFFGDGVTKGGLDAAGQERRPPWLKHGIKIEINELREVVNTTAF